MPTDASAAPAVTTVVPTHNRPDEMRRAVASALAQDYAGPIEVIVVFDATEPFTPDVDVPAGRTLRVIRNTRTRGLAGARNSGILEAGADYVAFLDDDDWWEPGKLTAQLRRFADDPDALLVGAASLFTDGHQTFPRPVGLSLAGHDDLLRDRLPGLHSSSFVVRREAVLGPVGLVDEDLPGSYGEDYDLLLRSAEKTPVRIVDEPLVNVTWAPGSSLFLGKWGTYGDGLEYLLDRHPGFRDQPAAFARMAARIAFARAAQGRGRDARRWAGVALRRDPRAVKAWLAVLVSLRILPARVVVEAAQRRGKGV